VTPPQTLAQKLIARASGRERVSVGEIVTCAVDLAMFHDSSGPRRLKPMLEELGAQIWDRSRVVLVMDHYVPERDDDSRRIVRIARDWARDQQLPHVYDSQGICHVVVPQHGHIRPGMLCVGGDSHSPTGGAFGAYMFGIGSTEMLGVVVTGEIWLRVPETIRMWWDGALPAGVTAKDMMLHMIGRFGMNGGRYQAVEFAGPAVQALSMQERMTLSNMSAELGAQAGLIAPDATTAEFLAGAGAPPVDMAPWFTDEDADFTRPPLRCRHAGAACRRAAQPRQLARREPLCGHARGRGLHRRLHRRQARRPARRGAGAARAQGGERASA
jgi:3-isopropylmalate/(R)-2-methylmalate dehydratase large subunit